MIKTEAAPQKLTIDFDNDEEVGHALGAAVRNALREHKRLGQSVAVWQDGKIVILGPEDIPVDVGPGVMPL